MFAYNKLYICMLALFSLYACQKSESDPQQAAWKKVDIKVHQDKKKTPESAAFDLRLKNLQAEAKVKNLRAILVKASEKICTKDSDCTLISETCCSCNQGGKKVAVSQQGWKEVITRRQPLCEKISCMAVMSEDPSCSEQKAQCVKGICSLIMPK